MFSRVCTTTTFPSQPGFSPPFPVRKQDSGFQGLSFPPSIHGPGPRSTWHIGCHWFLKPQPEVSVCATPVMKARDTSASAFKFEDQVDSQWFLQVDLTRLQPQGLRCKFRAQRITVFLDGKEVLTQRLAATGSGLTPLPQTELGNLQHGCVFMLPPSRV